jgi:hypothetical protein
LAARSQSRAPQRHADQLLQITSTAFPRKSRCCIIQRTAVYGPVCTVVREGRSRKASPYPDGPQRAPFNVHDVEQVVVTPRLHLMQTATHWSNTFGLYDG